MVTMDEDARMEFSVRWLWREFEKQFNRPDGDLQAYEHINYAMDITSWGWAVLKAEEYAQASPQEREVYAMQVENYMKRVFPGPNPVGFPEGDREVNLHFECTQALARLAELWGITPKCWRVALYFPYEAVMYLVRSFTPIPGLALSMESLLLLYGSVDHIFIYTLPRVMGEYLRCEELFYTEEGRDAYIPLRMCSYHLLQVRASRRLNATDQPDAEPCDDEDEPGGEPEPTTDEQNADVTSSVAANAARVEEIP